MATAIHIPRELIRLTEDVGVHLIGNHDLRGRLRGNLYSTHQEHQPNLLMQASSTYRDGDLEMLGPCIHNGRIDMVHVDLPGADELTPDADSRFDLVKGLLHYG